VSPRRLRSGWSAGYRDEQMGQKMTELMAEPFEVLRGVWEG
jgi:hypothetical protein